MGLMPIAPEDGLKESHRHEPITGLKAFSPYGQQHCDAQPICAAGYVMSLSICAQESH